MITHQKAKISRAILGLTTRELADELGVSAMAISRFERGDEKVISLATAKKAERFFTERGIVFGDNNSITYFIEP
ncbi:helix-turn-helix transcriptional regulator [uncultured Agitococcus sp.]|jgi:transcriptional regulator with XRE-family HTH domain|uniref:helix-turn-helix domain-containing protein n=1 Tax=uncultured Agitococcus sp. TaxID=1506599 RepID=UPI002631936C|nr:helix-turn-helix transcriptional regulator [uncultured Agitococcus sp.]